ncbi:MAG: hypothetical protein AVDCRST_MAG50-296 [uncultured Acidimicrobiales bacterium]|uniref:MOSC domain-containing protein n=1 Tax=uncultured Acidimicrobiales bacterium TaxID=310071 RepID=A0A6J4H9P0_9ACTN|nr:MAG: hypothetical protein AVDCRST_MAG50-296 [uncultured Acidimicrobiales bacterium]
MRVLEVWRYPVKSMQGESLPRATVGPHGLAGDRVAGLVDRETGLVLTARRAPQLLEARGVLSDGAPAVRLPNGTQTRDDDLLSDWLGRPVSLRLAATHGRGTYEIAADFEDEAGSEWIQWAGPAGTFHDSKRTQISVLSTGSIGTWDVRRFRPNVLVDGSDEAALVGRQVAIGSACLEAVKQIDRCVIVTRPQPAGIARDLDVLRTINRDHGGNLGIGTMVVAEGSIAVGDELRPS